MRYADFVNNIYNINLSLAIIIVTLNIFDYVTTLSLPAYAEINPIINSLLRSGSYAKLFIIKVVIGSIVPLMAVFIERGIENKYHTNMIIRSIPLILTIVLGAIAILYTFVVINNLQVLSGHNGIMENFWMMII